MTASATTRVRRTDRVGIGAVKRTAAGVLVVPASVSRTGFQTYRTHDGRERIEFRPESEVFAPAALESLKGALVTIGHLGPDQPRTLADGLPLGVGLVSDRDPVKAVRDGEAFVETSLMVTDPEAIRRIELPPGHKDRLVELSLDYTADNVPIPGGVMADGRRADALQANITVHSVALLEQGGARAGREARIRLDGHEELCHDSQVPGSPVTPPETSPVSEPKPIIKIKLDGKEFVEGSAEHIGHLNATIESLNSKLTAETSALTAKLAAADGATATEKARADGLATELAKAQANVPQAVAEELAFRDSVKALLPADYAFSTRNADGSTVHKSREQIKRDAIGAEACKRVDAQPEASRASYLDGAVHFALDLKKAGTPNYPVTLPGATHQDSNVNPIAAASDAMFKAGRGAK